MKSLTEKRNTIFTAINELSALRDERNNLINNDGECINISLYCELDNKVGYKEGAIKRMIGRLYSEMFNGKMCKYRYLADYTSFFKKFMA